MRWKVEKSWVDNLFLRTLLGIKINSPEISYLPVSYHLSVNYSTLQRKVSGVFWADRILVQEGKEKGRDKFCILWSTKYLGAEEVGYNVL